MSEQGFAAEVQPSGLCGCGCGRRTRIAKKTNPLYGHRKGQPVRFLPGHYFHLLRQDLTRFWESVDRTTTPDWCWEFTGARNKKGYGVISVNGRQRLAHHIALELAGFMIPSKGLQGQHFVCDNPPCCRPSHLQIGPPKKNSEDMVAKGRQARGEHNGQAKLTDRLVHEILALYRPGVRGRSSRTLAKQFGVGRTAVDRIIHGKAWKHITRRAKP